MDKNDKEFPMLATKLFRNSKDAHGDHGAHCDVRSDEVSIFVVPPISKSFSEI